MWAMIGAPGFRLDFCEWRVSAANLALQVAIYPCCISGHCPYVPGSSPWRSRPVDSVLENPRGFPRGCSEFGAQGLGQESNTEAEASCCSCC